jgi:SP family facilitated glucose transporter-like MFS transporter 8
MRISATICMFGWLSIHLAKVCSLIQRLIQVFCSERPFPSVTLQLVMNVQSAIMLYFGRILLGFSTGVLSYVVRTSCISELDSLHCLLYPISDPYQYQFHHSCFSIDNLHFSVLMRWIWQVPVFIAEIAPKNLRGGLATSNQVWKLDLKNPITRIWFFLTVNIDHWISSSFAVIDLLWKLSYLYNWGPGCMAQFGTSG